MTSQEHQDPIQTIAIESTIPIDMEIDNTNQDILEIEGVQIYEPRIKPLPITVLSRPLLPTTTLQMNFIEIPLDGQLPHPPMPYIVTTELSYLPTSRCGGCGGCGGRSGRSGYCKCYISKDCGICIAALMCIASIVLSNI